MLHVKVEQSVLFSLKISLLNEAETIVYMDDVFFQRLCNVIVMFNCHLMTI